MIKKSCAKCLQTASVSTRLKILEYLKKVKKRVTVTDIVSYISLRQPTVTFHLNKLQTVGLISKRKIGRDVYCRAHKPHKRCSKCPLFA